MNLVWRSMRGALPKGRYWKGRIQVSLPGPCETKAHYRREHADPTAESNRGFMASKSVDTDHGAGETSSP